jgi:very-short-patch-repair endonuclease
MPFGVDEENNIKLQNQGFRVLRFWEDEINNGVDKCLEVILRS